MTGLSAEARIARRSGLPVRCAGGTADGARAVAEALLDEGARGLVSFGLAGGLAPGLLPGALVVATAVIGDGTVLETDPAVRARLLAALPEAVAAPVAGACCPVATVADKAALHARTGAAIVDLESLAVARACCAAGRPFAVVRAVADPADRPLPPAALAGLDAQGRVRPLAVLAGLGTNPRQVAGLCRLAWDVRRALAGLSRISRTLNHVVDS